MIITNAEAAQYLGITFTTAQSSLVDVLIPDLQDLVMDYCKNSFLNHNLDYGASTISFDTHTISDSASGFTDFYAGDYKVINSKFNNGIITVTTVTDGALTVSETLVTEDAENDIKIIKVDFPKSIKPNFARFINHYLSLQGQGVKSESLPGGYSVTYRDGEDIMFQLFGQWRKIYQ